DKVPFYVPLQAVPRPEQRDHSPRRAAVNAFGIGGLNIHVVVDEYLPGADYGLRVPDRGLPSAASNVVIREGLEPHEPIAIVGRGAVLPGARTIDQFWGLLHGGEDHRTT